MNTAFMRFIVIMACLAAALAGSAGTARGEDAPALEWSVDLIRNGAFDWIGDMTLDGQGNAYVTGWKNNPSTTFAVAKVSPSGEVLWTSYGNTFPGYVCPPSGANGEKIKVDASGNSYVIGGGGCSSGWNSGMYAAKFSPEGEMLWLSRHVMANSVGGARDIAVDADGNVYLTGAYESYGYNRLTTVKFDSQGAKQWVRQYDFCSGGENLAVGIDNSIFVQGVQGTCYGGAPDPKWLLLRYDQAGNLINEQVTPLQGSPRIMTRDAGGNLYVIGTSGPSSTNQYLYYTIIKYNSGGDQLWIAKRERESRVSGIGLTSAAVDNNDGSLYLTGGITLSTGMGGRLQKFDSAGNFLWSRDVGTYLSMIYDARPDQHGNVYAAGTDYHRNYIRKYDGSGTVLWSLQYNVDGFFRSLRLGNDGQAIYVCDSEALRKFKTANQNPAANAGADRTAACAGPEGAVVALDGSGSSDPDGDPLTYEWTGSFGSASGVNPAVLLPTGVHTITLAVSDGRGGTSQDTVTVTVADRAAPVTIKTIAGTAGNNGWYTTDVSVSLLSTDNCTGVKEIHYSIGGAETIAAGSSASAVISVDGTHNITYYAVDRAGNNEAVQAFTVKIDKTPPVISISGISDGATYGLGLVPVPGYAVSDNLSGVAASGAALAGGDGNGFGTFNYTVSAEDKAGNPSTLTATYRVIATPEGLLALIERLVAAGGIDPNIAGSLSAKIRGVLDAGNGAAADGKLQAFMNQVNAQTGKKITPEAAALLAAAADYIMHNN